MGDEYVACYHGTTPDYHYCLQIDKHYNKN